MKDYSIEYVQESDLEDLFEAANDPIIRESSFNQNPITLSDHKRWFEEKINDKNCYFYIIRSEGGFVGSVRFDLKEDECFIVSIQVSQDFRSKGLAGKILDDATARFVSQKKSAKIIAYIKEDNAKSLRVFLKSGYEILDKIEKAGSISYLLQYKKL